MKARNNVQQTIFVLTAAFMLLVLAVTTADAQTSGKAVSGKSDNTSVSFEPERMVSSADYAASIEARRSSSAKFNLEPLPDPELRLESWMVNRTYFTGAREEKAANARAAKVDDSSQAAIAAMLVTETEAPLKLEAWMTDKACFPCDRKHRPGDTYTAQAVVK